MIQGFQAKQILNKSSKLQQLNETDKNNLKTSIIIFFTNII